jgi:hypothetical protein
MALTMEGMENWKSKVFQGMEIIAKVWIFATMVLQLIGDHALVWWLVNWNFLVVVVHKI